MENPVKTIAEVEKDHILATLEALAWNRSRAAKVLDLDRRTLYRKLAAYGVDLPKQSRVFLCAECRNAVQRGA